ncbi:Metallo-hydrolase/oxidoreductase [Periconia macrospinosa]|uniref:Metallo-hydrolase/oxidoreductase n=1 Tax=Periconia macrospinosa TaxID=97972 RepID=A0A2V1DBC8_9PLEO|nr:Metallo-hydrolase/oxidoreductase [Periconia macrospinosa]
MKHLTLNPSTTAPPTTHQTTIPPTLPPAKTTHIHHTNALRTTNATLTFIGTATTILEWEGLRILTDPNFLHAGDHVHLGPGVTGTRLTNPAIDLDQLPRIDAVLLSHYHEDHFDKEVEEKLTKSIPIITTPHAKACLTGKGEDKSFSAVHALGFFESLGIDVQTDRIVMGGGKPRMKVTGMPGKHVPPGPLAIANDVLKAVPPTNGWMLELGYGDGGDDAGEEGGFETGYRIYISGDTLMVDELKEIPERYKGKGIDLMLVHLGGTTIPGPSMPLLMVTMDAEQGVELMRLIDPELTIPIHYDDYDVFLSPLRDFKKKVEEAGLADKVVYLDRKDEYKFEVRRGN